MSNLGISLYQNYRGHTNNLIIDLILSDTLDTSTHFIVQSLLMHQALVDSRWREAFYSLLLINIVGRQY